MNISELQNEIEAANVLTNDLVNESLKIPKLHGKFLTFRTQEYLAQKNLEMQLQTVEYERHLFYTGKATPQQYKEEQFELKVLRTDLDIYMNADKRIQDIKGRIEVQKQKVLMCDEMIRALNQRTYLIKNIIEEKKFMNGGS